MRILFLTDNFPPEVNAPASRTFEHCREWVKAGHDVTVITCAPNFPSGKVFSGYRNRLWQSETMEGIRVIRVWSYITANEGFAKRTLDYVSYMLSAVLASPFVPSPDVIVATSPQFFTACAGYLVSRSRRRPYVFELRDLWPESIAAVGAVRAPQVIDAFERLELFLYRNASSVVSVTHAFKDNLRKRGIDPEKVYVVTNGADLTRFEPRPRDEALAAELGLADKFVAGYIGTHGMAHALETLIEAAHILEQREDAQHIRILFLGDGARKEAVKARAAELGVKNVVFVDTVSKSEVARYWSLLNVSVIHLKKTELFTSVIPSKLFEGMAMGIPVLHGVLGESAAIVEREGVGLVFEPENAAALAAHLIALSVNPQKCEELGRRARESASKFDRATLAGEMLELLETVAQQRSAAFP